MSTETSGPPVVLRRVTVHAQAAPGAATDIFTAFTPTSPGALIRIAVSLATGSVFNLHVTDGTTSYTQKYNGGTALTAGQRYTFTDLWPAANSSGTALTYSLQVATDGIIQSLVVDEVQGVVS